MTENLQKYFLYMQQYKFHKKIILKKWHYHIKLLCIV